MENISRNERDCRGPGLAARYEKLAETKEHDPWPEAEQLNKQKIRDGVRRRADNIHLLQNYWDHQPDNTNENATDGANNQTALQYDSTGAVFAISVCARYKGFLRRYEPVDWCKSECLKEKLIQKKKRERKRIKNS